MMRSLWTAASGMTSQQQNVDAISHNLANVNTTGYKKERMEFKSLLYQTMQRADLDPANGVGRPVNLQVGLGVRPIAVSRSFETGNLEVTGNASDVGIEGQGFFVILRGGEQFYTKDGSFKISITDEGPMLVTSEGYPVSDVDGERIVFEQGFNIKQLEISDTGDLFYTDPQGGSVDLGIQLNIVQFTNAQGLEAVGGNLFKETSASGEALLETEDENLIRSRVKQGVLEMSNVSVADEMVKLIVAQRAYELNSKAIQTSDDMLQQAANLKR